jgi:inosose dehydratase
MSWNVRIGINPISWMNDDLPSLGGDTQLETALAEGREIGYEGFELGNKFPSEGPALQAKLAEFGLACVSGWYSGFLAEDTVEAEMARCRAHMAKLQYNAAKVVVYGECAGTIQGQIDTPLARRPRFTSAAQWAAYGERLNAFGAHLQATYGITLAYHHRTTSTS